jgi:hypothetical protein
MADSSLSRNHEPAAGLPAVEPPSGKFIAQLFLVPLIIVSCLLGFTLLIRWWAGSAWRPEEYLEKLDDNNPDVRWRGAENLAQVLLRDDQLASDPRFALELAQRLRQSLQGSLAEEKSLADRLRQRPQAELARESRSLQPERERLLYLSACLGNVMLPVGAPVLSDMAVGQEGADAKAVFLRRSNALWALVNLGKNLNRFKTLPQHRQDKVLAELEEEAATSSGSRNELAKMALEYFKGPHQGSLAILGVEKALRACAEDVNPFLREISAMALSFWQGTPAEKQQMNAVLARLAHDDGRGEDILARFREDPEAGGPKETPICKRPGLTICFNATIAMARRGCDDVRLGMLASMLDRTALLETFRIKKKEGKEEQDQALVDKTVEGALQAVIEYHRQRPERDLSSLYQPIEEISRRSNTALRVEAQKTLAALGQK